MRYTCINNKPIKIRRLFLILSIKDTMATLILRETHDKLIEEMKLIDKLKIDFS